MRYSKYNIFKTDGNSTWIFNCLTSSFVMIENKVLNELAHDTELQKGLINEGILTNEDNEIYRYKYLYYHSAFQNQSIYLTIAPTMKCNFACHYCFEEGNKNLSIMDEDVENAIVEYLHINRDKKIAINWFGGEPLMGFARIVLISHKLKNLNIKFRSSIVTNGSLLDEDKINQLHVLNLNHLQISLDGLAHTHNKRRYFKTGKPSFDLIISNIENFLRLTDIHLYIQVTVDKTNSNAYEDIVKFFNEKFPTYMNEKRIEIGVNAVQNRTDFERKSDCFNQEEVFLKNKIRLSQTKRKNLSSILPGIVPSCMYRNPTSFAIDPSGDMFKCLEHLGNSEYKVGNIKEKSVSLSKMAQATFGLDPFEDEECLACNVFPICGGGCPLDRQKKKMGKSINYCSIYKTRLADMLPALYECYEQ